MWHRSTPISSKIAVFCSEALQVIKPHHDITRAKCELTSSTLFRFISSLKTINITINTSLLSNGCVKAQIDVATVRNNDLLFFTYPNWRCQITWYGMQHSKVKPKLLKTFILEKLFYECQAMFKLRIPPAVLSSRKTGIEAGQLVEFLHRSWTFRYRNQIQRYRVLVPECCDCWNREFGMVLECSS